MTPQQIKDYVKMLYGSAIGTGATAYSLGDILRIGATEKLKNFIAKTGGDEIPAGESVYNNIKHIVNTAVTGAGVPNSIVDKLDLGAGYKPASDQYYTTTRGPYLDILNTDSKYILSTALTAPTVNSLVKFIASGGTALGTPLPDSKSMFDILGSGYTGAAGAGGNIKDHLASIASIVGTQKAYFKRRIVMGDTGGAQELTADPTIFEDSDAHAQSVINTWEDSALEYTIDGPESEVKTVKSVFIDLTWKDQITGATATAGKSKWQINRGNAAPATWDDLTDDHATTITEAEIHRSGAIMNETNGLQLPFKIKLVVQADVAEAAAITVKPSSECQIEVEYEI